MYKSIEKFTYQEIKLETIQSNAPSEGKPQHLMCSFMAAKKQAKEHCTSNPANPNSTETARQIWNGNTGFRKVLLNLCFPPLLSSTVQSAKRTLAGATLHLKFKVSS